MSPAFLLQGSSHSASKMLQRVKWTHKCLLSHYFFCVCLFAVGYFSQGYINIMPLCRTLSAHKWSAAGQITDYQVHERKKRGRHQQTEWCVCVCEPVVCHFKMSWVFFFNLQRICCCLCTSTQIKFSLWNKISHDHRKRFLNLYIF